MRVIEVPSLWKKCSTRVIQNDISMCHSVESILCDSGAPYTSPPVENSSRLNPLGSFGDLVPV